MSQPASKPRVLIVDDNEIVGRLLKEFVESLFDCQVSFPQSATAMAETTKDKAFDSVLVDADLSKWRQPKIFGKPITDGIEFARLYCQWQPKSLIVIFGANNLPGGWDRIRDRIKQLSACNVREIKSPLPSESEKVEEAFQVLKPKISEEIKEELPVIEEIHQENPIFQPPSALAGLHSEERRLRSRLQYRRACEWVGNWMNENLHEAGDSSWTLLCDGDVQKQFFGELLNGREPRTHSRPLTRYPHAKELEAMAQTSKTNPLIFWNTRNTKILSKQLDDHRVKKIPSNLGDTFGLAVAPACARAYHDGPQTEVIDWCSRLAKVSGLALLDALKAIYVSLNGNRERSVGTFAEQCRRAGIIKVVDIYTATVEEIQPRKNTAIIELTNSSGDDNFIAPFDFANLVQKGIKETSQKFEYTVYADIIGNANGEIELME